MEIRLILNEDSGDVSILWDNRGEYVTVQRDGTVSTSFTEPRGRTVYTGGRFVPSPAFTYPRPRKERVVELPPDPPAAGTDPSGSAR